LLQHSPTQIVIAPVNPQVISPASKRGLEPAIRTARKRRCTEPKRSALLNRPEEDTNEGAELSSPLTDSSTSNRTPKANTARTNAWAMGLFENWRTDKNVVLEGGGTNAIPPIEKMSAEEVNANFLLFLTELRKPNGTLYEATSIVAIAGGIHRHLCAINPTVARAIKTINIPSFLRARMREQVPKIIANRITPECEVLLWVTGELGIHSDEAVLNTVLYYNCCLFDIRSRGDQSALKSSQISVGSDECGNFVEYRAEAKHGIPLPKVIIWKHYAMEVARRDAMFAAYVVYLNAIGRHGRFYRQLRAKVGGFTNQPIGKNTLSKIIKKMCQRAGLQGDFTNHSVLLLDGAVKRYDDADVSGTQTVVGTARDVTQSAMNLAESVVMPKEEHESCIELDVSDGENVDCIELSDDSLSRQFIESNASRSNDVTNRTVADEHSCSATEFELADEVSADNDVDLLRISLPEQRRQSESPSDSARSSSSAGDEEADVTSSKLRSCDDQFVGRNTAMNTAWAVRKFEAWRANKNRMTEEAGESDVIPPLNSMSAAELDKYLLAFLQEIHRIDGTVYNVKTPKIALCGIFRHLEAVNAVSVQNVNKAKLFATIRSLHTTRVHSVSKSSTPFTHEAENRLWITGQLGAHSFEAQLNTVFFYNCRLFGLKNRQDQLMLKRSQINVGVDERGQYLEYRAETRKGRRLPQPAVMKSYAEGVSRRRDMFAAYTAYLRATSTHGRFYKRRKLSGEGFYSGSLGTNTMMSLVKNMCKIAGLKGRYTSLSIRSTNEICEAVPKRGRGRPKRQISQPDSLPSPMPEESASSPERSGTVPQREQGSPLQRLEENGGVSECTDSGANDDGAAVSSDAAVAALQSFIDSLNNSVGAIRSSEKSPHDDATTGQHGSNSDSASRVVGASSGNDCTTGDNSEMQSLASDEVREFSTNTKKSTEWSRRLYNAWRDDANLVSGDIPTLEELTMDRADAILARFITEVRKENGSEFSPLSLNSLVNALFRAMQESGNKVGSVYSAASGRVLFKQLRLALSARSFADDNSKEKLISTEQGKQLWNLGEFGCQSAEALINTVFFYNCKLFGLRGCNVHHRLQRNQINTGQDERGPYIEYSEPGGAPVRRARQYTTDKESETGWDLHTMYEKYLALIGSDGCFYRRPIDNGEANNIAFSKIHLGKDKLSNLIKSMCQNAGPEDRFTGTSVFLSGVRKSSAGSDGAFLNDLDPDSDPDNHQKVLVSEPCDDLQYVTTTTATVAAAAVDKTTADDAHAEQLPSPRTAADIVETSDATASSLDKASNNRLVNLIAIAVNSAIGGAGLMCSGGGSEQLTYDNIAEALVGNLIYQ
jgi:hypothetical protein